MARSSSPEDSPAPPDEDRLAQLEALLADSLFSAPTRNHPAPAPEDAGSRPTKRKKTEENGEAAQDASEAGALTGEGSVGSSALLAVSMKGVLTFPVQLSACSALRRHRRRS